MTDINNLSFGKTADVTIGESSNITIGGMNNPIAGLNGGVGENVTKDLGTAMEVHGAGKMPEGLKSLSTIEYGGEIRNLSEFMRQSKQLLDASQQGFLNASMGLAKQR